MTAFRKLEDIAQLIAGAPPLLGLCRYAVHSRACLSAAVILHGAERTRVVAHYGFASAPKDILWRNKIADALQNGLGAGLTHRDEDQAFGRSRTVFALDPRIVRVLPIDFTSDGYSAYLCALCDARSGAGTDATAISPQWALAEIAKLAEDILPLAIKYKAEAERSAGPANPELPEEMVQSEPARVAGPSADPTLSFLAATLARKTVFRVRPAVSFVTLRAWRRSIREYQLAAFRGLQAAPPEAFADFVAAEMMLAVDLLVGPEIFGAIVPIPGALSGDESSLAKKIAANVARRLGVPMLEALRVAPAASRGRGAKTRGRPLQLAMSINAPALLIDDIAFSGDRLEEAAALLKPLCRSVQAVAWLSDIAVD